MSKQSTHTLGKFWEVEEITKEKLATYSTTAKDFWVSNMRKTGQHPQHVKIPLNQQAKSQIVQNENGQKAKMNNKNFANVFPKYYLQLFQLQRKRKGILPGGMQTLL